MNKQATATIEQACALAGAERAPVVMLSHSLATHMRVWQPQLEALAAEYRVLRYDIRGHGRSEVPLPPYALAELTEDAVALLDALGIDRVHWVGLSLGGMIGQQLALSHPDRLLSLTLADTTSQVPAEAAPAWDERAETAQSQGMDPLVEPTLERWLTPAFREREAQVTEEIREMIRGTPPQGYAGCCQAIKQLALTERLPAIALPALVMVGEADEGTPVAAAEVIAGAIPGAELAVLPVARHLSNIEAAPAFNERLLGFLNRL